MNSILTKLAKANKNIVLLYTEALNFRDCEEFSRFFPEKSFSFGLAEANMVSAAAGFALAGKLPIVFGNAEFLVERAFEQIKKDICLPNLNVKMVGVGNNDSNKKLLGILENVKLGDGEMDCLQELCEEYGPAYLEIRQ